MNIGSKLKEVRLKNKMQQKDIAKILNIAETTYCHNETQEAVITIKNLNSFCNYFNVSFDFMFDLSSKTYYLNAVKDINNLVVGKRLKDIRKENKLTQKDLANILGTVHQVIANYENGKHLISTLFLYDICKKYKVSADYLLGKIDDPKYLN